MGAVLGARGRTPRIVLSSMESYSPIMDASTKVCQIELCEPGARRPTLTRKMLDHAVTSHGEERRSDCDATPRRHPNVERWEPAPVSIR